MSGDIGRVTASYYHENRHRCPCCNRPPDKGRLLPCLHTVCTPCLSKAEMTLRKYDKKKRLSRESALELCFTPASPRPLAPLGWFLCPLCHSSHLVTRLGTTQLPLAPLTNPNQDSKESSTQKQASCTLHSMAATVFCHTCNQLICTVCRNTDHPTHEVQDLDVVSRSLVQVLRDATSEIQERVKVIDSSILQIRSVRTVGSDKKACRKEVMSLYEGYINRVRQNKKYLEPRKEDSKEENLLLTEELKLVQYKTDLESLCHQISDILEKNENAEVVRLMVPLAKRLEKISEKIFATGEILSHRLEHFAPKNQELSVPVIFAGWSVDPSKSHLRLDSHLYEKVLCSLPLILVDSKGVKVDIYRKIDIKAEMTLHTANKGNTEVRVVGERCEESGEWRLSFTPPGPGIARLTVTIQGHHIKNSPYIIHIRELELDVNLFTNIKTPTSPLNKVKKVSSTSRKDINFI